MNRIRRKDGGGGAGGGVGKNKNIGKFWKEKDR